MDEHHILLIYLSLAWLVYFGLHSLLASPASKDWVARHWPRLRPGYRLGYNLLALVLLGVPLWLFLQYPGPLLWRWSGGWAWLANSLALLALLGFILSSRAYDNLDFLGLRQWRGRRPGRANSGSPSGTASCAIPGTASGW